MLKTSPKQSRPVACFGVPILACSLALSACGSSNDESSPSDDDPIPSTAADLNLTFHSVKTFRFSWSDVADASHYKLMENPDGVSGFTQVGSDIVQGTDRIDHVVPLYARTNAQYILQSCTSSGCVDSDVLTVSGTMEDSIGYIKASNTDSGDLFGDSVSLSADGNTLAVGSWREESIATGIDGDQNDNSIRSSGAVYVFAKHDNNWSHQAYIKASNTDPWDWFGGHVSLSADGNTLAVGASGEGSNAGGVNGNQHDNSAEGSGAVYVFDRSGDLWSQQAYIKASNTDSGDFFGDAVSLSADGNTLAVGADGEDSSATGVNGNQSDNLALGSGAVYVFVRNGDIWSQQEYLKASNTEPEDDFGGSVSLSANGNTLAVGAWLERSLATGVNGDQNDNSAWESAGAAYVFTRSGNGWSQKAYIKASNTDVADFFAGSVTLSGDGTTLAVGASSEWSNATGVNGNQNDNSVNKAGAVYLFVRIGSSWSQQAYIKASNTNPWDFFGNSVSLSENGNILAVGSEDRSNAIGVNGDQSDNSVWSAGAVYVFTRRSGEWIQQSYLKASNSSADDFFGRSVSLSGDGNTLAVGAFGESGNATGVDSDQNDNSAEGSGAVYLY